MFNKKPKKVEIEFRVNVVNGEALHIKRTGSYILQLDHNLPQQELVNLAKKLRYDTGAKWVIVQGGAKVITNV